MQKLGVLHGEGTIWVGSEKDVVCGGEWWRMNLEGRLGPGQEESDVSG